MTRGRKIAAIVGGSILGLILIVFLAGIAIVRTEWFRDMVRSKLVTVVEDATGGKVEIGSFTFDWTHLRAQVRNFVIHGLEPAGAAPLLRAELLQVDLKLLSPFKGFVDIANLLVDAPQANVIVFADGHTNVPNPKVQPKSSDKTGLETIVDLAIGHFELRNGSFTFAERKTEVNANGEQLRAMLHYNAINPRYTGEIDIAPLHVKAGANPAVDTNVKLPLMMEKDRISLSAAEITTAESRLVITGAMEHLTAPHTNVHLKAQVALDEAKRVAGLSIPLDTVHAPRMLNAEITGSMDEGRIAVQDAHISLGQTHLEATGTFAALQFNSSIALGELGRLLKVSARPEGTLKAGGNVAVDANNNYLVTANVAGRQIAFRQGTTHPAGINLDGALKADPHRIALDALRLTALGGSFGGSAALQDLAQFELAGSLHNLDIDQMTRAFLAKPLGYDGVITGTVRAQANIKDTATLVARANLTIAPGRGGIPVSGQLGVDYNGRSGNVTLASRSFIALPHTRVDLAGSLGQQIQAHIISRNFDDFRPLAVVPVSFTNGGAATVDATIGGSLSAPRIAAQIAVNHFAVEGRPFTSLTAALDATKSGAAVNNGLLSRGALQAQFSGSIGLHNWTPEKSDPLRLDATVRNGDVRDVLALAGQSSVPVTGLLTADTHITGTVGDPRGGADLNVVNGTIEGEPFDTFTTRAVMTQTAIDVQSLQLVAGPARVDATAHYQHALNNLERGTLTAHVASNQVQLAQFQSLVKDRPGLRGILNLNADASADSQPGPGGVEFQITNLTANAAARGLQMQGKALGDFTLTATTAGNAVRYNVNSDFAGSTIRVNGESLLTGDHQTTATAAISGLPLDRVLAVAGRTDLPVSGTLALTGQLSGTVQDPRANVNLTVTKATAYGEPFDRLQTAVNYTSQAIDVPQFRIDDGPSHLELTANFTHPANNLQEGSLRFHVVGSDVAISRIQTLQRAKPGLDGVVKLAADGAATLRRNAAPLFSTLNANLSATGLSANKKPLGDLTATAATRGSEVNFDLKSSFARSNITGTGRLSLAGDYPLTAQLKIANLTYVGISPLLDGPVQPFDGTLEGHMDLSGPIATPDNLRGALTLTTLEAHSTTAAKGKSPRVRFDLRNAGNIVVALERSLLTVQNFHITGPFTTLNISGAVPLKGNQPMNLRADGNIRLEVLEAFDTDIFSSGAVTLNAAVTGTPSRPSVNGTLRLQQASFNLLEAPQGISNATGVVAFNGTEAVLQNISGESGGGKVTLSGAVSYGGPELQFRLQATANRVHIDAPATVTTQFGARLTLTGTTSNSLVSGNVFIQDVAMHSHSDIGSVLASAATPPPVATASTGLLGGMHFDVRIRTSPDVQFRTTLTQNLQADANLTLRGTPDHPGILGRVVVTQGEVIFFGAKYTIDQGTVAFYDPQKIAPILNVDLETTVQGVDVSVSVSGPIERMKLSYRSDPPMEFQQIVSLLASGKVPTTDPVLAAHTPAAPAQNFQQAGASTLLGQAVASPISGRLQRLFGVSKLSIDPQIVGTSNTPQATLTFQQQVTKDITFTYIQDVTRSNSQSVRVEWAISPQFSAVAQRDLFGEIDLDFFYKKRFH